MPDTSLIGLTLAGRFRLTGVIGEGGMATVYRGVANDDEVAVKIMNPELAKEQRFVRRFRREAKAASVLKNPNIVQILEFGVDQGYVFLAMELLRGFDLAMLLHREKRIAEARALRIVAQVCRALTTAHGQSIVHRDLKPDNIMLVKTPDGAPASVPGLTPQDFVKVLDFGIAKILDDDGEKPAVDSRAEPVTQEKSMLTRVGTIVGTPAYMAPEQGRAEPVDARTDIYACGVLLYELITGRVPFLGETPMQVVMRHVNEPPRPPSDFQKVHPEVEKLIMRALAKYAVQRQQSAEEMEVELLRVLALIDPSPVSVDESNKTLVIETGDAGAMAFPTLNIEVPDDIFPSAVFGAKDSEKSSSEPQTRRVETPTAGAAAVAAAAIPVVKPGAKKERLSQTMQSLGHEETALEAPRPPDALAASLDDDEEAATMVKAVTDEDKQRMSLAEEAMAKALQRPAAGRPPEPPPTVPKVPKPAAGKDAPRVAVAKPNVPTMVGPESVEPTLVTAPNDEPVAALPPVPPVPAAAPHPHEKTAVSEPSPPPKRTEESSKIRIAVGLPAPPTPPVPAAPATNGAGLSDTKQTLALAETMRVDVEEVEAAQRAVQEPKDGPIRRPTSELVPITIQDEPEPAPELAPSNSPRAEPALWSPAPQKKRLSGGVALFLGIAIGAILVAVGLGVLFLLQ